MRRGCILGAAPFALLVLCGLHTLTKDKRVEAILEEMPEPDVPAGRIRRRRACMRVNLIEREYEVWLEVVEISNTKSVFYRVIMCAPHGNAPLTQSDFTPDLKKACSQAGKYAIEAYDKATALGFGP